MKILKTTVLLTLLASMLLNVTSCKKKTEDEGTKGLDPESVATLSQYVNNVVITTYKSLADASIELKDATATISSAGATKANVQAACDAWVKARKYWEQSEAFLFGAAGDYNIDPHIDSWPLDKGQLDILLGNPKIMKDFDADYAGTYLGYGLLGFHAVEYVLFRDGKSRLEATTDNVISAEEAKFAAGVAEDLMRQAIRLEASWAGIDNVTADKKKILTDAELEPTMNYGEAIKKSGEEGNTLYPSLKAGFTQILSGCIDIADEVGNTKITDPVKSGEVLDVESWYSWNSITDFADNIRSIQNAYLGGVEGKRDANASLSSQVKKINSSLDTELTQAIANAITEIEKMPAPFRNNLAAADSQSAVDACNALLKKLEEAKTAINEN